MIKFTNGDEKEPLIGLGLSHMNLDRLRDGKPLKVDLKELGFAGGILFIFAGKTEAHLVDQVSALIDPKHTKVKISKKLKQ